MDSVVWIVILLVVVVIAAVVVAKLLRDRNKRPVGAASEPLRDPLADHQGNTDVRTVRVGDMIDYRDELYFVRGSLRLTEGGYSWAEHFLDNARGDRFWISVEADPDLEVVLWRPTDSVTEPGGKTMEVEGVTYRKEEDGTATYRSEGTTTVGDRGSVKYVDYEGSGGKALSFEKFDDGKWEAGLGEEVVLSALKVYPAGSDRT